MQLNYTQLVSAIQQYTLEGTAVENPDFSNFLPTIINLAEDRLIRDLNLSVFDEVYSTQLTPGSAFLVKPNDYLGIRSLRISSDNVVFMPLTRKDITWLENYWRNVSLTSEPMYYSNYDNVSFKVAPTPNLAYYVSLRYIRRPTPMSATNPNTWLGTYAGDVLLYACLVEAMGYLREDLASEAGLTASFEARYNRELEKAKKELSNQVITGLYY